MKKNELTLVSIHCEKSFISLITFYHLMSIEYVIVGTWIWGEFTLLLGITNEDCGYFMYSSSGNSAITKTTEASKKLFTHLPMQPTNTANTVISGIQYLKLVLKKCSSLLSVLSEKVQRTREELSTRAQYIGISVVGKCFT